MQKKNAILYKLFWYEVFVHWKLKLLNFLTDYVLKASNCDVINQRWQPLAIGSLLNMFQKQRDENSKPLSRSYPIWQHSRGQKHKTIIS